MFRRSGKHASKLFIQDNCPVLKCAQAQKTMRHVDGLLFAIPKRSPDLNPIENVFNLAKRELKRQAITLNITSETFQEFKQQVKTTLYSMRSEIVGNIIASMCKRIHLILQNRGRRTKY